MTKKLLNVVILNNIKRFIFISSSKITNIGILQLATISNFFEIYKLISTPNSVLKFCENYKTILSTFKIHVLSMIFEI